MIRTAIAVLAALVLSFGNHLAAAEPLKIAYSDWPGWTAFEIAIQKGWFKEAGVDVQFTWMDYGATLEAYQAGKVDGITIASGDVLVVAAAGKATKGILLTDYSFGNDMIIGGPGVASIKDLKGKKVGVEVGLVDHLLLLKALEVNGLKESDITIVPVATNDTPAALASGGVDAICCWQPICNAALKEVAGSKPLFTSKDAPGLIYDFLAVSVESYSARKDDWAKVVGVWPRIVAYINDPKTHDDAVAIMAARVGADPKEYAKFLPGTFFLDAAANKKAIVEGPDFTSVLFSMTNANAFNLANKVYTTSQDPKTLVEPALVLALP